MAVKRVITLQKIDDTTMEIEASVYKAADGGEIAIHPKVLAGGGLSKQEWAISHVPSGLAIFSGYKTYRMDKKNAHKIARLFIKLDIPWKSNSIDDFQNHFRKIEKVILNVNPHIDGYIPG